MSKADFEELVHPFPPIAARDSKVLILGSMPSAASMNKSEYYGHPRNHFWPILFSLFNREYSLDYTVKKKLILDNRLAIWDAVASCRRSGSSDSSIRDAAGPDFSSFFAEYIYIEYVFFNGIQAENIFRRVTKDNICLPEATGCKRLPSTSPANTMSYQKKLEAWKDVITALNS